MKFLFLILTTLPASAKVFSAQDYEYSYPWPPQTFAIWVQKADALRQDVPVSMSDWCIYRASSGKSGVRFIVNNIAASGASCVWFRLFGGGQTEYPSMVDEATIYIPHDRFNDEPDFDPLRETVEYAHSLGLKVYAWYTFLEEWHGWKTNVRSKYIDVHPLLSDQTNKGIKTEQSSFYFEQFRQYKLAFIREVLDCYDVDGFVFDLERNAHRNNQWGYLPQIVEEFRQTSGLDAEKLSPNNEQWMQFRAAYVGKFLEEAHRLIKNHSSSIEIVYWNFWDQPLTAHRNLQDWADRGLFDSLAAFKFGDKGWGSSAAPDDGLYELLRSKYNLKHVYYGAYAIKDNVATLSKQSAVALREKFDGLVWFEATPLHWWDRFRLIHQYALETNCTVQSPLIDMSGGGELAVFCNTDWDMSIGTIGNVVIRGKKDVFKTVKLPEYEGENRIFFSCNGQNDRQFSGLMVHGTATDKDGLKSEIHSNLSWQTTSGGRVVKTGRPGVAPFLSRKRGEQ
jgi:hypothetical protein